MKGQTSEELARHGAYMRLALEEAEKGFKADEVPVGAVLVDARGDILAAAHNLTITLHDPSAHAEILVLRAAGQKLKNYRFLNTSLYVTIEPCVMCMGAMLHARVGRLVFGAKDPRWGAAGSLYDLSTDARLNHRIEIISGVLGEACGRIMQDFFKTKRKEAGDSAG